MNPSIRIAHHYQFPPERNHLETGRHGYCYAFHLFDRGKGSCTIEGRAYTLKKGDLLCIPPQVCHSFYSEPEAPLSSLNIYAELGKDVPLDSQRHLYWSPEEFDPAYLTPVAGIAPFPVYTELQHHSTFAVLFAHSVHHYAHPTQPGSRDIAYALLKALVLEIRQLQQQGHPIDYRIQRVVEEIDREAAVSMNYEHWLARTGLAKSHFYELFKQATGLSPKAYWTRAIMNKAVTALRESPRPITDIAGELGYASIHHFTKQFKLYYGVSPSVYRKLDEGGKKARKSGTSASSVLP